jgi:hypothetical protein
VVVSISVRGTELVGISESVALRSTLRVQVSEIQASTDFNHVVVTPFSITKFESVSVTDTLASIRINPLVLNRLETVSVSDTVSDIIILLPRYDVAESDSVSVSERVTVVVGVLPITTVGVEFKDSLLETLHRDPILGLIHTDASLTVTR